VLLRIYEVRRDRRSKRRWEFGMGTRFKQQKQRKFTIV
jgi:hypothetical protein